MEIISGKEQEYNKYKENNTDSYGSGVVRYGEAWANLMESELGDGVQVEDIAKDTSHRADTEGITGFMYGCAVSALARFWTRGEELRTWHNLDTQLRDEGEKANKSGGTLNPALLDIDSE